VKGRRPERCFAEFQRTGSPRALAAVFDLVGSDLLLLAGHLARDTAIAEDLVQETFLKAIEHAGQFDRARPLMPWLVKIFVNQARMERRRRSRAPEKRHPRSGVAPGL
jgi:DNA-directed RNA polymerase specialized sigma24 family protein